MATITEVEKLLVTADETGTVCGLAYNVRNCIVLHSSGRPHNVTFVFIANKQTRRDLGEQGRDLLVDPRCSGPGTGT
jgi:hypothetical protein